MKKYRVLTTNGFRVWIEGKDWRDAGERFRKIYPSIGEFAVIDGKISHVTTTLEDNPPPEQLQDEQPM